MRTKDFTIHNNLKYTVIVRHFISFLICFFILLSPATALSAPPQMQPQRPGRQVVDSLTRLIETARDDSTRFKMMHRRAMLFRECPEFIDYEEQLASEARKAGNHRFELMAVYSQLIFYYNSLQKDSVEAKMKIVETLSELYNDYTYYFKAKKFMSEFYVSQQLYEFVINEAEKMVEKAQALDDKNGLRDAYLCLATGYLNTGQFKGGIQILEKVLQLTTPDIVRNDRIETYAKAIIAYNLVGENDKMMECVAKLEKILKEQTKEFAPEIMISRFFVDSTKAIYYVRKDDAQTAWKHLKLADENPYSKVYLPYTLMLCKAYAEYSELVGEKAKAVDYLLKAAEMIAPYSRDDVCIYRLEAARLLNEMGQSKEALRIYEQETRMRDSLNISMANAQVKEFNELYNLESLQQEKEKRQETLNIVVLSLILLTTFLLAYYYIHSRRIQRRLARDEQEMRHLAEVAQQANEAKGIFLGNMSYNVRIAINNVMGFSQILSTENGLTEEEQADYATIIKHNSTSLIDLVNDVLELSRLEARMTKWQMQTIDVKTWCEELSGLVNMRSEGKIHLTIEPEVGNAQLEIDPGRLTTNVSRMLLYPIACNEVREVKLCLIYLPESQILLGRVHNSPLADKRFDGQKAAIYKEIDQLFFEHFGGNFQLTENQLDEIPVVQFTVSTLCVS